VDVACELVVARRSAGAPSAHATASSEMDASSTAEQRIMHPYRIVAHTVVLNSTDEMIHPAGCPPKT
jgi:hypothetical protein